MTCPSQAKRTRSRVRYPVEVTSLQCANDVVKIPQTDHVFCDQPFFCFCRLVAMRTSISAIFWDTLTSVRWWATSIWNKRNGDVARKKSSRFLRDAVIITEQGKMFQ